MTHVRNWIAHMLEGYASNRDFPLCRGNGFGRMRNLSGFKKCKYTEILFVTDPPGHAGRNEENIHVESAEHGRAAVRTACRYYSHIRWVHVFRDDGYAMTP